MTQASPLDSRQSRSPEPWTPATPDVDDPLLGLILSVEEQEAQSILEMRYQEYLARRMVEELFERGELESLPG